MYITMGVIENITLDVMGHEKTLPLIIADGMIGAIPVFDTKENAEKYADGHLQVVPIMSGKE